MANQKENDSLTYEKLQRLINLKLTQIEESHIKEEVVDSKTMNLGSPLRLFSSWQHLKEVALSIFLLNDFFR